MIIIQNSQNIFGHDVKTRFNKLTSWETECSSGISKFLKSNNLNNDGYYKNFNYWNTGVNRAITFSAIKNISSKFGVGLEWLTTKLLGDWNAVKGYPIPPSAIAKGLAYPTPYKTGMNQLCFTNLNQVIVPNSLNNIWHIYVKVGGGFATLKEYSGLDELSGTKNRFKYSVTNGGGIALKVNCHIRLKFGTTYYITETDRLDGVYTVVKSLKDGTDLDIKNINERFIYTSIGMTYKFGKVEFTFIKNRYSG